MKELTVGIIPPRRIFISYAHADNRSPDPDQRWLDRLLEMIAPLDMMREVGIWTDRNLDAGDRWETNLEEVVNTAEVAVLLVSPAYLASRFVRESELPSLLYRNRQEERSVDIIPVVLRHCLFEEATFECKTPGGQVETLPLGIFQAINPPSEPLEALQRNHQDLVLRNLARRMYATFKAKAPVAR